MKNNRYILLLIVFLGSSIISPARNLIPTTNGKKSTTTITSGCLPAATSVDLDLNNVRALIHTGGDMWWDLANNPRYEVPKGSGKHSLFAGGIWVGGVDVNGQLRLAARMYRSDGNDYWPGPLISSGEGIASVTADVCSKYDKLFKITKEEVSEFIAWYNADADTKAKDYPNYSVPQVIKDWPAHGPVDLGAYDYYLAPFQDVDGDGAYNPDNGDYPYFVFDKNAKCKYTPERWANGLLNTSQKLFGDMTMWWVYNDKGNVHTQSTGAAAIGMEFHAQAFAFSTNDDLNNMTFYNYQIINRSTYTLADAYFGVWTDADLGDPDDDFVGCDVNRGLGYLYNGKAVDGDGSGKTYGAHPPAIGIDFFEGPYQDPDGEDNPSSWKELDKVNLDCQNGYSLDEETGIYELSSLLGDIFNGNINGLNFGDGVKDNERWGMRRFLYFNRGDLSPNPAMADPSSAVEFYNFLKGIWKDGVKMTYGRTGYKDGTVNADFMFPNNTDICSWGTNRIEQDPWNEETANAGNANPPGDRRFVQSAGPFTLEPGAVNDITLGAVWARANSTPWASVEEVRKADIKAQRLFENCFQLIDGPRAPDLTIIELDNKFIFHLSNKVRTNNYLESYREKDPFIDPNVPEEDQYYVFQGYQVFQLKDKTVTLSDIDDNNLARQVFECDIQDGVTQIVNYIWDPDLQASKPIQKVLGNDQGIVHSFDLNYDAFATGHSRALVNYKEYYYVAVAFAYNNFNPYNPVDEGSLGQQVTPYLAGRENIKTYTAIPKSNAALNGGTVINSDYGSSPSIRMREGLGNGYTFIDLTDESLQNILSKSQYPFKADSLIYKEGYGPVGVKVIDPINVLDAQFRLTLSTDSVHKTIGYYNASDTSNVIGTTGLILDTKWNLSWTVGNETKVVTSDNWIRFKNEIIIPEIGLSITCAQVDFPDGLSGKFDEIEPYNNGFVGAEMTYQNEVPKWLGFVPDADGTTPLNWIRSGSVNPEGSGTGGDYLGRDAGQVFEKVLGGTWAPYLLASNESFGPADPSAKLLTLTAQRFKIASINVVITKDKDLWTRCPVIEMAENDATLNGDGEITNSISEGGALRFQLRAAPSKNKEGVSADNGATDNLTDQDAPNYIGATGMSWFPGYAIDVETGERLNIAFGEDSWMVGEHGNDMLWNPTSNLGNNISNPFFGGKHYIYIFGHNEVSNNVMPGYDEGKTIYDALNPNLDYLTRKNNEAKIWQHPSWTAIPLVSTDYAFYSYDEMPDNPITIKIRMANPYFKGIGTYAVADPVNDNYPTFEFSTSSISAAKNDVKQGSAALDKINIVPNPYYGYSEYESTQLDNTVKITNLPARCIISIYTPNGYLIRRFDKDNDQPYITWDLKNTYGVSIASGIYIIHVNAPGLGEKVVKWYGSLRPVDLNSF